MIEENFEKYEYKAVYLHKVIKLNIVQNIVQQIESLRKRIEDAYKQNEKCT